MVTEDTTHLEVKKRVIHTGPGSNVVWSAEARLGRRITARDVLAIFLAYYWRNRPDIEVPGTFLVSLLSGFDLAAPNVRATLRRLEREELLQSRKAGRNHFYRPSERSRDLAESGVLRILNFGLRDDWDGTWTIVMFSIPETQSNIRLGLRESLRPIGFAPYYDGVWIAPGDRREAALNKADLLGVTQFSTHLVDHSSFHSRGRRPIDSWDLDDVARGYRTLINEAEDLLAEYNAGRLSPTSALARRTTLLARYRWLVPLDPGLPVAMMPEGWLRNRAREVLAQAFDELGALSAFRIDQLLDGVDEPWAGRVREAARMSLDELASFTHGPAQQ